MYKYYPNININIDISLYNSYVRLIRGSPLHNMIYYLTLDNTTTTTTTSDARAIVHSLIINLSYLKLILDYTATTIPRYIYITAD